jgi:hypothetical protein
LKILKKSFWPLTNLPWSKYPCWIFWHLLIYIHTHTYTLMYWHSKISQVVCGKISACVKGRHLSIDIKCVLERFHCRRVVTVEIYLALFQNPNLLLYTIIFPNSPKFCSFLKWFPPWFGYWNKKLFFCCWLKAQNYWIHTAFVTLSEYCSTVYKPVVKVNAIVFSVTEHLHVGMF